MAQTPRGPGRSNNDGPQARVREDKAAPKSSVSLAQRVRGLPRWVAVAAVVAVVVVVAAVVVATNQSSDSDLSPEQAWRSQVTDAFAPVRPALDAAAQSTSQGDLEGYTRASAVLTDSATALRRQIGTAPAGTSPVYVNCLKRYADRYTTLATDLGAVKAARAKSDEAAYATKAAAANASLAKLKEIDESPECAEQLTD